MNKLNGRDLATCAVNTLVKCSLTKEHVVTFLKMTTCHLGSMEEVYSFLGTNSYNFQWVCFVMSNIKRS